jgi:hypothetical protein
VDTWGEWLVTAAGALVVGTAVRDVFHTLWHPSGRGVLSDLVLRSAWRLGRRVRRHGRPGMLTAPAGLLLVIVLWLALLVLGGALVYAAHMPEAFVFERGVDGADRGGFLDAVYLSMVTVGTLGFGDLVPDDGWLRIAVPAQALLGFGLLSAAVTWVLQIHSALSRRRALAVRLGGLWRVNLTELVSDPTSSLAAPLLEGLAADLAQARVDITQYTETFYFRDGDAGAALPAMIGVAAQAAARGRDAPRTDVRLAGELLAVAIDDFANAVDREFLHTGGSTDEVLHSYADAHGYRLAGSAPEADRH